MAKSRDIYSDLDQMAYCLTLLIEKIAPTVDKGETFDLLYELLEAGIDEQTAKTYGAMIRASALQIANTKH